MKERKGARTTKKEVEPIVLPADHRLIFLEKDENVIAICTTKGCGSVIFKGSDQNQISNRVLRERCNDHASFYATAHKIDVIYPRSGRIIDSEDLFPLQLTAEVIKEN